MHNTPMLRGVERLREAWMEAVEDRSRRLLVWRLPANAQRLLAGFFELQRHEGRWSTPDYFLRMDAAFATGFDYSRSLKHGLLERYLGSQGELREQGVALGWRGPLPEHPDTALGVIEVMEDFVRHHDAHMRTLALVLEPYQVSVNAGMLRWIDAALAAAPSSRLRLVLVDSEEDPRWQPLLDRHAAVAARIAAPVDMFELARDTASQSGGSGPQVAYRQMLADLMLLIERGTPQQVDARAARAFALAERHGWDDQQASLRMMTAGAWLKSGDHGKAIHAYRQARDAAQRAAGRGNPAAPQLVMQGWFGEAGCWLTASQFERAAQTYLSGAECAAAIPHPMFDLEGRRMAAWCLSQHGQREVAREHLLQAVRVARPLAPADRRATTLPQALWDLLQLQDKVRARKLHECAEDYLQRCTALHARAEEQAAGLGARAGSDALERIEGDLHAALEQSFHAAGQEREQLIQRGDEFFRKVVAVAREFLDPSWNGLPDIHHPLDHEVAAWSQPPAMQPLPDPAALLSSTSIQGAMPAPQNNGVAA